MAFEWGPEIFTKSIGTDRKKLNTPTSYELIVSEKLQTLPVPDMADAIWARIEQQLDLDMPTDDPDGNPPASPSGGWRLPILSATILLIAAIAYLIIAKKPESPLPLHEETPQQVSPITDSTIDVPASRLTAPSAKQGASPQKQVPDLPVATAPLDSGQRLVFSPKRQDTVPMVNAPPLLTRPVADTPKTKRPRGVSGISDTDYKIAPAKKDS
jgi:hypothetical protein